MSETEVVTLASLCGGGALELFQAEWAKVLQNIADVNTDPEKTREVVLRVKVTPNEAREMGDIVLEVTSKLASFKPVPSLVYLAKHRGELVAVEHNPKQLGLSLEAPAKFPVVGGAGTEV